MSNTRTGADRMPDDLADHILLSAKLGCLIAVSTTPVIAVYSFEIQ